MPPFPLKEGTKLSDKQDRVAPRTACDILRKYNFGKTFAETMGIAKSAQNTANKAADTSTKSVQALDAKLDHEEVFNRLTKNGALQGLYRGDDGELYVNASYLKSGIIDAAIVQVVNLIAERLKSVDEDQELCIEAGRLVLNVYDEPLVQLGTNYLMQCYMTMRYFSESGGADTYLTLNGNRLDFIGVNTDGVASIGLDSDGIPFAQFDILNGKNIEWKDNGDGTFSLIGR